MVQYGREQGGAALAAFLPVPGGRGEGGGSGAGRFRRAGPPLHRARQEPPWLEARAGLPAGAGPGAPFLRRAGGGGAGALVPRRGLRPPRAGQRAGQCPPGRGLGRAAREFRAYARRIRAESTWLPEAEFRARRAGLLAELLRRPALYRTAAFRRRYERRARRNLRRELKSLERRPTGRPGSAAPGPRRRGSARPGSPPLPAGRRG